MHTHTLTDFQCSYRVYVIALNVAYSKFQLPSICWVYKIPKLYDECGNSEIHCKNETLISKTYSPITASNEVCSIKMFSEFSRSFFSSVGLYAYTKIQIQL